MPKRDRIMNPTDDVALRPIQGKMPDSLDEMRVAIALDELKYDYTYQYQTEGIKGAKGTYSIDFMVWTVPIPQPLEVKGAYWHTGSNQAEDEYRDAKINKMYAKKQKPVLSIYTDQTKTVAQAKAWLRMHL